MAELWRTTNAIGLLHIEKRAEEDIILQTQLWRQQKLPQNS